VTSDAGPPSHRQTPGPDTPATTSFLYNTSTVSQPSHPYIVQIIGLGQYSDSHNLHSFCTSLTDELPSSGVEFTDLVLPSGGSDGTRWSTAWKACKFAPKAKLKALLVSSSKLRRTRATRSQPVHVSSVDALLATSTSASFRSGCLEFRMMHLIQDYSKKSHAQLASTSVGS